MLANPLSPLGCHNQHCAASGLCSFCSGVCGGGRVLFDGNTLKKSCQPVFFLDVCPAGKLVAVQTTPPEALGMCDVQYSHCSCLPWSLQPVRDAGGGGRSVTPILLLPSAFHRSARFGQRERWGEGAELLGVEERGREMTEWWRRMLGRKGDDVAELPGAVEVA